jgi:hypothetical protein
VSIYSGDELYDDEVTSGPIEPEPPDHAYDVDSGRYLHADGREHPVQRSRRQVEESSPAAFWGDL